MADIQRSRYGCAIFDMDGTILNTVADCTKSVNLTMLEFGYPLHTEAEVASYLNNGAYRLIERALPQDKRQEENVTKVLERYLEIYAEHVCEKTHPYDGIAELMQKLKNAGVKLAVVSNKPDKQTKMLTDKCFPLGTFAYVSGSGEGLPVKPDRACVEKALVQMNVSRQETVYVGDSYVDVLTARNSQIPCAGVLWGVGGEHSFDEHKPDFLIRNTKELEELFFDDIQ